MLATALIVCFAAATVSSDASAPATNAAEPSAMPSADMQPFERTYRVPLGLAYFVPLSFEVATWFVPALKSGPYSVLGAAGMFAAPFMVHVAQDNSRGAGVAALGIVSSLLGGAIAGAAILVASGHDVCGRSCDDWIGRFVEQMRVGGAVGAGVGYLGWAIFDTAFNAHVARPTPARPPGAIAVQLVPIDIALSHADMRYARPSGVSLGLMGVF